MNIQALPKDIFFEILSFCDTKTAVRMSAVCLRFAQIINSSEIFWKNQVRTFSLTIKPIKAESPRHHQNLRKIVRAVSTFLKVANSQISPPQEWYTLYQKLYIEWTNAKKYKEKKALTNKSEFEARKGEVANYKELSKCARSSAIVCSDKAIDYTTNASLYWLDNNNHSLLDLAIRSTNVGMVKLILKAGEKDLRLHGFLMRDGQLIQRIVYQVRNESTSQIFREVLDHTSIQVLKSHADIFSDLVECGRFQDALVFFEALEEINVRKKELIELLLTPNLGGLPPLNAVCRKEDLEVIELYFSKFKEMNILNQCLYLKDSAGKTPVDYLNERFSLTQLTKDLIHLLSPNPYANMKLSVILKLN